MINSKKVKIKEIMNSPPTNSGLKRKHVSSVKKSEGDLPVYSASQDESLIFGWIGETHNWRIYDNVLTWNKDGSAGKVFYRKNKFIPYEKVKILAIKSEFEKDLDYTFLKFALENKLMSLGFGFNYKCSMERVLEVEINIPINKAGYFDINEQRSLAEKYLKLQKLKKDILTLYNQITEVDVYLEEDYKSKEVEISSIFDVQKGSSKYTKSYVLNNKGNYPLYSSQTVKEGVIGFIDRFDYDTECITWTTDGIHAGTVFHRKGKFSMTTHCGVLLLKKEIKDIDLSFVYFQLKRTLKAYATGEGNKRVTAEIIQPIAIFIPCKKDGSFDLDKQKEIAKKLRSIELIRKGLMKNFTSIKDATLIMAI